MANLIETDDLGIVFHVDRLDEIHDLDERFRKACSDCGVELKEEFVLNNDRQTVRFDFDGPCGRYAFEGALSAFFEEEA
jgi:hypothetical protein